MKNAAILLSFLCLITSIFYIYNLYILFSILLLNFIICFFYKISIAEILYYNKNIFLFFILIISIFNLFFSSIYETFIIDLKLIIACNLTFLLKFILPTAKLIQALEVLLSPLKILKINTEKLSIIINIAINFIPIFINEINSIDASLVSKGVEKNLILKIKYIAKLILPTIFYKTKLIEYSLKAKNYIE